MTTCLIVGAGLSGLVAAQRLQDADLSVHLLEASSEPGGRLAVQEITLPDGRQATFDAGAQFFTARDPRFQELVDKWMTLGIVQEWSRGFATADGSYYADGHPRYRGDPTMTIISQQIARSLDISYDSPVTEINPAPPGWSISTKDGRHLAGELLILTPPVPQSLELLDRSQVSLTVAIRAQLESITYEPCIALMAQLAGKSQLPKPGGMWPVGEPISWLADNYQKGVSPVPGSMTIHAGPEFSHEYWQAPDAIIADLLLEAANPWLGKEVLAWQLRRWPFSKPMWLHSQPYVAVDDPGTLVFAGDAFAGPRVEGAVLSGLAAAEHLLR